MSNAKLLTAYLAGRQPAPFSWPGANCGHFAAGWVKQAEGFDPMAGLAATPTRAAAARLLRRAGGYAALVTRQLGREPIEPAFARIGDLVLMQLGEGGDDVLALGVCAGGGMSAFVNDEGHTVFLSTLRGRCAWRVGT
jgi:hypothetical protein